MEKYPRQAQVLRSYLKKIPVFENITLNDLGISKKSFELTGINSSSLNTLIKKGIFETWEHQIDRFSFDHVPIKALPNLTIHQQNTLIEIQKVLLKNQQHY